MSVNGTWFSVKIKVLIKGTWTHSRLFNNVINPLTLTPRLTIVYSVIGYVKIVLIKKQNGGIKSSIIKIKLLAIRSRHHVFTASYEIE